MGFSKNSSLPLFCILGLALILSSHAQDSPQDYVNAHNAARAQVGVGPVTWDDRVASYAQNYANQRKGDCNLVHSGGPYGENLAWSSAGLSGTDAVKMWVNEKADYDYNSNTCAEGKVCGHYTQVVWRNSVRIGCAKDLCSINFTTTRRSPSNASSPDVPAQTDKSEYAGCSPGANPPTLKSDMKASSESQSSALLSDGMGLQLLRYGQTWDLACYATVQGKAWLSWLCETLRVTPRFWGKRGCHGSVRSCVLRHGSGESVAVVPRFSCWRARLANCRRPGLLAA
ncbi:SCP domain-containing protein [Citrus sinensis]|uniref:SCP domain-containing protein n=1 Tax=Citrus sinensis TaxID=2711 RepID=A0ACB8IDT7_CITSI|nr:SCP domain-containing protein [Citrus sinensis]